MDDVTTEHDNDFDALEDNTDIINNDNDNLGVDPTALDSRIRAARVGNTEQEVAHCRKFRYASSPSMANASLLAITKLVSQTSFSCLHSI